MADHEISKIMWIAVVVSLAASIYFIARPQINTLAGTTFDNVGKVVQGIKLPGGDTTGGGEEDTGKGYPEQSGIQTLSLSGLKVTDAGFDLSQDVGSYTTWFNSIRKVAPNSYLTNPLWDSSTGAHINVSSDASNLPDSFVNAAGLPTVYFPIGDLVGKFDMTKVKSIDSIKVGSSTMYLSAGQNKNGTPTEKPSLTDWSVRYDLGARANKRTNADITIGFTLNDGSTKSLTYSYIFDFGPIVN